MQTFEKLVLEIIHALFRKDNVEDTCNKSKMKYSSI